RFRTVSFSSERTEPFLDKTRTQSRQAVYKNFAAEMIKLTGRNRDVDRDVAIDRCRRLRRCLDFYFIVTTRSKISLKTTRDVGDPRVGERLLQQIVDLSAQRVRAVNCLPVE